MAKVDLIKTVKLYLYRKLLFWFMDTRLYYNVLKYIIPFIRLSAYYPRFNKFRFKLMHRVLQPGDILFSNDYQKLTAKIIGGEWAHVGVCVAKGSGPGQVVEVVEMTHENFHVTDFFKFCAESERVMIGRVDDPRWNVRKFIDNIWKQKDSKYNFTFRAKEKHDPRKHGPTNKQGGKVHKFNYCSQLVMEADEWNIIKANWDDLAGLGVPYISPTGLAHAENIRTVIDSGKPEGH